MRMTPTLSRRAGVTLIEVLVAIFVVAIGLLALLTLFPLGALTMGQAIKDDRIAQTAANATATLKVMDVLSDANVSGALANNPGNAISGSLPGYAVYFDPIGFLQYAGASQSQVGGVPGMSRVCSSWLLNAAQQPPLVNVLNRPPLIRGWFTNLDDMTFTNDGSMMGVPADDALGQSVPAAPNTPGGPFRAYPREGRFTWAAMLRRPHVAEGVTEVYIAVYSGRSANLNPIPNLSGLAPAGETPLGVAALTPTVITVNLPTANPPDIRSGAWILDGTPAPGHGDFYRVTNVTVNGNGTADLELQTPIKVAGISQVILMDNLAEVIFKGVIGP
jgi:prepilin-type N-terminal cleavage/methylation domain-containing protein